MAVLTDALVRITTARAVPAGMWALLAAFVIVAAAVPSLALVLDYQNRKIAIESEAALRKNQQDIYREVLEKSVCSPTGAMKRQELTIEEGEALRRQSGRTVRARER